MFLYSLRLILSSFVYFGLGLIACFLFLFRPFNPNNSKVYARVSSFIVLKILGVKVLYRASQDFIENSPCIYIGNHQDTADLFIYGSVYPENTISIGKKQVKWIPIFGWGYWLSGHLFLDRKDLSKAKSTLKKAEEMVINGATSILIMPEGTRTRDKGLMPFKKGAFHMAINTQAPINAFVVSSYVKNVDFKKWNSGTIIIDSLPSIPTKGLTKDNLNELIEKTTKQYQDKLDSINNEVKELA
jgi:1-acyl-sn-glycerol-3-phosphate acyltransferase